jgi:hypothetical protein
MNSSREVRGRLKKRGSWLLPHRWRKRRPTVRVAVRRPCNVPMPIHVYVRLDHRRWRIGVSASGPCDSDVRT